MIMNGGDEYLLYRTHGNDQRSLRKWSVMISWLKSNIQTLQLKNIKEWRITKVTCKSPSCGLNLNSLKLDLTEMIFFISDWTEHPNFWKTEHLNFWKTHNYFPMFNLTWVESHIQLSCASRVQWSSQNFRQKPDPVKILPKFLKTPMKSE